MSWVLKTAVTPPIVIDSKSQGASGEILKLVKPTLEGEVLGRAIKWAPYGTAPEGVGYFVVYGFAGLAVFGAWSLVRLLFRR